MHTTEAIVAIDCHRLNDFALTIRGKGWASFDNDIKVGQVSDADKLIKAKLPISNLTLIVLGNTCSINLLLRNDKQ